MSVKQALVAILAERSCYGSQLRGEFERRTGGHWPLNVGQVYNTLERLERDGLVARADPDERGNIPWHATAAGREAARAWFDAADAPAPGRDPMTLKLALAATLPGADLAGALGAEIAALRARLAEPSPVGTGDSDPVGLLLEEAEREGIRARLGVLERFAERAHDAGEDALAYAVDTRAPRRGRPVRGEGAVKPEEARLTPDPAP